VGLKPVSVSQLNSYIKRIFSADPILMNISVTGEISGLTRHSSGHWYFSLKDEKSSLRCFLPSDRVAALRYDISEGMQVCAHGYISVYERGGYYSLNVRDIEAEGEGALAIAFEKLKNRLQSEGLFDPGHKRQLPAFPSKIGVVTSPTGAAVRDIITTVRRRSRLVDIIIYPCLVQGPGSAQSVADAVYGLNEAFPELDLIIVGRGGGSAEDLWTFNEEAVARAVYNSKIPVISAVGHERDVVISDMAADVRAATPTAAAELAVPHMDVLSDAVSRYSPERMFGIISDRLRNAQVRADSLKRDADSSLAGILGDYEHRLRMLKLELDAADPALMLEKGYAMAGKDGSWISSVSALQQGDVIELRFRDGKAQCSVIGTEAANG